MVSKKLSRLNSTETDVLLNDDERKNLKQKSKRTKSIEDLLDDVKEKGICMFLQRFYLLKFFRWIYKISIL